MADQCEMIIGYLVPHRCEHVALGRCTNCKRTYCDEHVTLTPKGLLCLACQQGLDQPVSLAQTVKEFDATDLALFASASQWDKEDTDKFSDLS